MVVFNCEVCCLDCCIRVGRLLREECIYGGMGFFVDVVR